MQYFAVALMVGISIPLQATLNAMMGIHLNHPVRGAFLNFAVGTVVLALLLGGSIGFPAPRQLASAPWYYYLAGVLGASFVFSTVWLVPKIGTAAFLSLLVTGQMLMSTYLDHVGAFGMARTEASPARLLGILLLVLGVTLVVRK